MLIIKRNLYFEYLKESLYLDHMKNSEEIFDKEALIRSRVRSDKKNNFLQKVAVQEIENRLKFIKKLFLYKIVG